MTDNNDPLNVFASESDPVEPIKDSTNPLPPKKLTPAEAFWSEMKGDNPLPDLPLQQGSSGGGNGGGPTDPPSTTGEDDDKFRGWRGKLRNRGVLYLYLFYALIFILAFIASLIWSPSSLPLWPLVIVAVGCFVYFIYEAVTPREHVILSLGGMIILPPDGKRFLVSGPHFIPPPVKMIRYPNTEILMMFGTAQAGTDAEREFERIITERPDMPTYIDREPVRVSWNMSGAGPNRQRQGQSLADVLTTDPPLYVILKISDPENYYLVVGESVEEGLRRIRVVMVRALQEIAGSTSVSDALGKIGEINSKLKLAVEKLVADQKTEGVVETERKPWGVDIVDAAIMTPGFSKDVNKSFALRTATVIQAEGAADATVRQADADSEKIVKLGDAEAKKIERTAVANRKRLTEEGLGEEEKRKAIGRGDAAALAAKGKIANTKGGRMIIQTEALRDAVKEGNVTILPAQLGGLTDVLAGVAAGAEMLKGGKKSQGENPTESTNPPKQGTNS